jgi:hypothetical protein
MIFELRASCPQFDRMQPTKSVEAFFSKIDEFDHLAANRRRRLSGIDSGSFQARQQRSDFLIK